MPTCGQQRRSWNSLQLEKNIAYDVLGGAQNEVFSAKLRHYLSDADINTHNNENIGDEKFCPEMLPPEIASKRYMQTQTLDSQLGYRNISGLWKQAISLRHHEL